MRLWPLQGWDFLGSKKFQHAQFWMPVRTLCGDNSPPVIPALSPCPFAASQNKIKLLSGNLNEGPMKDFGHYSSLGRNMNISLTSMGGSSVFVLFWLSHRLNLIILLLQHPQGCGCRCDPPPPPCPIPLAYSSKWSGTRRNHFLPPPDLSFVFVFNYTRPYGLFR